MLTPEEADFLDRCCSTAGCDNRSKPGYVYCAQCLFGTSPRLTEEEIVRRDMLRRKEKEALTKANER